MNIPLRSLHNTRFTHKLTTGFLIAALMIGGISQGLLAGSKAYAQVAAPVPATVNSGVNLVVDSFTLTNASGTTRTSFAPGEAIYVRSAIRNSGTVNSKTGTQTQFYAHQPLTVAVGSKNSPEISVTHGYFNPTSASYPFIYESRPNGARVTQFSSTKYFTQTTPGTYVARVFADANNIQGEPNETDNQRTVTYTITGTAPAPTTSPLIPPTVNSGVNLVVDSFALTNSSGTVKTTFAAGEAIYVRSAIRNSGTLSSKTGTVTQYYANQPSTVAVGAKNVPEISTTHGIFDPTSSSSPYVYESRPNGSRVAQFTLAKYFTQSTPGTYVARVFADTNNIQGEPNETDNQRTVTYTITEPVTSPWPSTTVWPQPVQNPSSLLAIVNKKFKLSSDYVPANLRTVAMPVINNQPLRNEAATALEQMNKDALSRGIRMHLRSGYRSYWTQNTLYNNYVAQYGTASADTFSARPGHSEHQTGLGVDVGDRDVPSCDLASCFATTKSGVYVAQNGHRFGFIIRYPKGKDSITGYTYEPWHLRFVGVSAATSIYNSGLTMEEYFNVPGGGYQ